MRRQRRANHAPSRYVICSGAGRLCCSVCLRSCHAQRCDAVQQLLSYVQRLGVVRIICQQLVHLPQAGLMLHQRIGSRGLLGGTIRMSASTKACVLPIDTKLGRDLPNKSCVAATMLSKFLPTIFDAAPSVMPPYPSQKHDSPHWAACVDHHARPILCDCCTNMQAYLCF